MIITDADFSKLQALFAKVAEWKKIISNFNENAGAVAEGGMAEGEGIVSHPEIELKSWVLPFFTNVDTIIRKIAFGKSHEKNHGILKEFREP